MNIQTSNFKVGEISGLLSVFADCVKGSRFHGHQRNVGKTREAQDAEDFLRDARKQLSSIHPHLYIADGAVRG